MTVDARARRIPEDFSITPDMRAWAQQHAPVVNLEQATAEFVDHFLANGKRFVRWDAAWRNWIRRVPQYSKTPELFARRPMLEQRIAAPTQIRDHPLFKGVKS